MYKHICTNMSSDNSTLFLFCPVLSTKIGTSQKLALAFKIGLVLCNLPVLKFQQLTTWTLLQSEKNDEYIQIIAQRPTQYVLSTPHSNVNEQLFEMTHS